MLLGRARLLLEAACNVRQIDEWKQFVVRASLEISVSLTEIDVDQRLVLDWSHGKTLDCLLEICIMLR